MGSSTNFSLVTNDQVKHGKTSVGPQSRQDGSEETLRVLGKGNISRLSAYKENSQKKRKKKKREGEDVPTPPPPSLDTLFRLTLKNRGKTKERQ
jgi:hypothetical protein